MELEGRYGAAPPSGWNKLGKLISVGYLMDDDPKVPAPGEPRPLLTEEPKENGVRKVEN